MIKNATRCFMVSLALALPATASSFVPCHGVFDQTLWPTCSESYELDSGYHANAADEPVPVSRHVLSFPRAEKLANSPWTRIVFSELELHPESSLELTSLYDRRSLTLSASDLYAQRRADGAVELTSPLRLPIEIRLVAAPRSGENRFRVAELILQGWDVSEPLAFLGVEKRICGTDQRVPDTNAAVARLMPEGCTGFLIEHPGTGDRCMLTAAHCDTFTTAEFDVPASGANCQTSSPADANDVFAVDPTANRAGTDERGKDWRVFRLQRNGANRTAFRTRGTALQLVTQVHANRQVEVVGYGVDTGIAGSECSLGACGNGNSGARSQTLQHQVGPMTAVSGDLLTYTVDTCPGNSGGPVIQTRNGKVVGIHRGGNCQPGNVGTSILAAPLQAAIKECGQARAILVLDRTGSMLAGRSGGSTRCADALVAARQDIERFFKTHPGGRMAVWSFAGSSATVLSNGYVGEPAAKRIVDSLSPNGCSGLTPLAEAVCDAADHLAATAGLRERQIFLSTDGGENNSSGECNGFNTRSTTPPYDPGSWQHKVYNKLRARNVVMARIWGGRTSSRNEPEIDPETGEQRAARFLSDGQFLRDLSGATDGSFQTVTDDGALPPPLAPAPVFVDGFERGDLSAWSQVVD